MFMRQLDSSSLKMSMIVIVLMKSGKSIKDRPEPCFERLVFR